MKYSEQSTKYAARVHTQHEMSSIHNIPTKEHEIPSMHKIRITEYEIHTTEHETPVIVHEIPITELEMPGMHYILSIEHEIQTTHKIPEESIEHGKKTA